MAARRAWLLVAAHACLREAHGTTAYEERSLATRTQETAAGGEWGTEWITTVLTLACFGARMDRITMGDNLELIPSLL